MEDSSQKATRASKRGVGKQWKRILNAVQDVNSGVNEGNRRAQLRTKGNKLERRRVDLTFAQNTAT